MFALSLTVTAATTLCVSLGSPFEGCVAQPRTGWRFRQRADRHDSNLALGSVEESSYLYVLPVDSA